MAKVRVDHPILSLPFVRNRKRGGRDFWVHKPSDDMEAEDALGREWGRLYLDYARRHNAPFLLGWIVGAMVDRGTFGQAEICFLQAVSEAAVAGRTAGGRQGAA